MNSIRSLLTILLVSLSLFASAKDITDTLCFAKKDRIIVTYSITRNGNKVDLQLKSVKKQLGSFYREKYDDAERIKILFFDWIGVRKDVKFTGETPMPISWPAKATYRKSADGYFVVEERPSLSFDMETSGTGSFSIPLFLAHYEGKQHYKILCPCGELKVNIPKASTTTSTTTTTTTATASPSQSGKPKQSEELQEVEIEVAGDGEDFSEYDDQALSLINSINSRLPLQDTVPMESTLERKIENLVDLQAKVKNEGTAKMIDETLEAYNSRKKELEVEIEKRRQQKAEDDAFANCSTKEDYERYSKQYPNSKHNEAAKEKADELEAKEKKRNIMMIVGGVLLALLLFGGNQAVQGIRNKRNQRNMMKMQQDVANKAKTEAKNQAERAIHKETNKVTSQVREKGKTMMRDTANKAKNIKGNNRVSI